MRVACFNRFVMLLALLFALGVSNLGADGTLVLYTAANEKLHADVVAAFTKLHPDITVTSINLSTGPITEKAIAEKDNPQADVVYAVNTIALDQLKNAGVLEPYKPSNSRIPARFVDPDSFYSHYWLTVMVMAVNTRILKEKNILVPAKWADLIRPEYKGQISIAAATKSGTGLTIFTTLVDAFGWDYLDKLNTNIFKYNGGGGEAGAQAGKGEVAIGLTYDTAVLDQVKSGLPVQLVFPEITPNTMEGGGLVAGAPHPQNAKLFLDFMASPEGAKVYAPYVGAAAIPGFGNLDISHVNLWKMRRPVDADEFKKQWASRYEH